MHSNTHFCDGVTVTVPCLEFALAVYATVLNDSWALLILAGFFLSVCLVDGFLSGLVDFFFSALAIAMVVVVDKKEREERYDDVAIVAAIGRSRVRIEQL